jgi:acetyl-CoA synthetase
MREPDSNVDALVQFWLKEYSAGGVNAADFICDRHDRIPEKVALFYENAQGETAKWTFKEFKEASSRLAGFLKSIGIGKGDRVGVMLPKTPELIICALATWRLGAAYVPLFTAFGPDAVDYRVLDSHTGVVITNAANRAKLGATSAYLDGKLAVVTVCESRGKGLEKGDYSFWHELGSGDADTGLTRISGEDSMILLYTSGTTGNPKGVDIPVKCLASFEAYMKFGLDLREDDTYWNMADPGWAYGLYYNLIGPLLVGKATMFFDAPFTPGEFFRIMSKYRVTNFASSPTAYRGLKAAGDRVSRQYPYFLRLASSAGEPLNPEVIEWSRKLWGIPIHDQFGQTELGMAANNHHMEGVKQPIKMGSMGPSMPGFRMVAVSDEGQEVKTGQEGQFAVDIQNSPLYWFRGYWKDDQRTQERMVGNGRYYLAGDTVKMDDEGYFFFSGRSDDIVLSAGYRIGPFEVESALVKHPSVAEAAVVGKPDELRGEAIKAYVTLVPGAVPNPELAELLKNFVKEHLSAHEYPREVEFVEQLPKTPSGKIQRFLLKQREYDAKPLGAH